MDLEFRWTSFLDPPGSINSRLALQGRSRRPRNFGPKSWFCGDRFVEKHEEHPSPKGHWRLRQRRCRLLGWYVQSSTESHWSIWRIRDQATTIQYFDRYLPPLLPPHTPTMVYKKKTNQQEHPPKVISVIWAPHYMGYSASKIQLKNGLPKPIITSITRQVWGYPSNPFS